MTAPPPAVLGASPLGQGFEAGPEGQVFLKPVDVLVPFDPARLSGGADTAKIQLLMAPSGSNDFVALQSTVDLTNRMVRASTIHFTQFVPAQTSNPVFITTSPMLPQGSVGVAYAQQLEASGGTPPYHWTLSAGSSLPPGLSVSDVGLLAGSPIIPIAASFFVTASDSAQQKVQMAFSLIVLPSVNPVPVLTQMAPASAQQGSGVTAIALTGTGFVPTSQVLWDGAPLATTFVVATQLAASIPASALASSGTHQVAVSSPTPGGGTSASIAFTITPNAPNPVPTVTSVTPTFVPVSSVATQIAIVGSSFISSTSVAIGAQGIATVFLSPTQLSATIPATFLSAPGTLDIGVFTPPPGGGFSATRVTVTVGTANPVPALTSLIPLSVVEGSGAFTLTATGTSFAAGGQLFFASTALTTTIASATSASATVPAALVASSGSVSVILVNPTPGGGASGAISFSITSADAGSTDATVNDASDAGAEACAPPYPTDAGACGQVGAVCCGGNMCNASLSCVSGVCAELCGHVGEPCCGSSCSSPAGCLTGWCIGGGMQPFGSIGQQCVGGSIGGVGGTCDPGLNCTPLLGGTQGFCMLAQPEACLQLSALGCNASCCGISSDGITCEESAGTAVRKCCMAARGPCASSADCCGAMTCNTSKVCVALPIGAACTSSAECMRTGLPMTCDSCTHTCTML